MRREEDYEDWKIDGAKNIDMYDDLLEEEYDVLEENLDKIPKDEEIGIVCVGGVTSGRAAQYLENNGYSAVSLQNGMREWGRFHKHCETDIEGIEQIIRPGTGCVSHIIHDSGEAVIVDPSQYVEKYNQITEEMGLEIIGVIDTHAHADHISGGPLFSSAEGIPYFLHNGDSRNLSEYESINEGDNISVGSRSITVKHTPGHTPGSISLLYGSALLSGDTLFLDSVGRPDLEGANDEEIRDAASDLFESLQDLKSIERDLTVFPGHFSEEEDRPLSRSVSEIKEENELFSTENKEEFIETIFSSLSETPSNYEEIKKINWGIESLDEDSEDLELGPNNCAAN